MSRFKGRYLAASTAVLAACALAGCGYGGDGAGSPAATGQSTSTGDGVLRFAYTAFPSTLDPHKASTAWDELYTLHIFDRLVTVKPDQTFAPMIAESWSGSDGEITFKLRTGATFHDGTPIDAEAVRANLDRAMNGAGSTAEPLLKMVKKVQAGDGEITIEYTGAEEALLNALAHRGGALVSPKAFGNPDLDRNPVGSGPYRVTSYRRDDKVVYAPYDGYYDKAAQRLKGLEMSFVNEDDTRLNGVRSGQYDATLVRPEQVDTAKDAGLKLEEFLTGLVYQLNINSARSEFADQKVRQALNYAVDRKTISEKLLLGSCIPSVQAMPPGHWAHEASLQNAYPYDPAKAKALLAEAGVPNGFSFTALVWNNTAFVQLGEAIQDQFKAVGVDMKLRPMAADQSIDLYQNRREADALVSQIGGAAPDPGLITQQDYLKDGLNNPGGTEVPKITELAGQSPPRPSVPRGRARSGRSPSWPPTRRTTCRSATGSCTS
ncbi:peptide/nickel transport system substrate-binding protein [Thermocatellispora tengchongensis]|uniref:Peptide/nickel transport system substrate-binding protein n=1 Tax=Thermocatellispora tengchongensis TaxID=1073253 RepID=A0A840PL61_9ACTN|nr:ABC transporter substrate-binding protein [Thermocatellispora tengchongensis]MBB5138531.1 peptide/nickel transport system substrate-binding protein [Thermocatellispora tengchongensis]